MIAIIGDIHSRLFWKDVIPKKDEFEKIIFLGDYLDPYDFEGFTKEQAIVNFKEILEFKRDNLDKVILLQGNHDLSYSVSRDCCDCRCDYKNYDEIQKLFRDNFDLFELFYKFEQNDKSFLFSHAGIADKWIDKWFRDRTPEEQLEALVFNWKSCEQDNYFKIINILADVSFYRGGYSLAGSIVWRDVRESLSDKFEYQIFGHTMLSQPIVTNKWACLDCQRVIILDDKNNLCNLNGQKLEIYEG